MVTACDPKAILISGDVNRLRLVSKLNLASSARRLWPDLPYKVARSSGVSGEGGGSAGTGTGAAGGLSSWFGRAGGADSFDEETLREEDVAFLQFTSGSTSEPKGVMVTFANLAHNTRFISGMMEKVCVCARACMCVVVFLVRGVASVLSRLPGVRLFFFVC